MLMAYNVVIKGENTLKVSHNYIRETNQYNDIEKFIEFTEIISQIYAVQWKARLTCQGNPYIDRKIFSSPP